MLKYSSQDYCSLNYDSLNYVISSVSLDRVTNVSARNEKKNAPLPYDA